MSHHTTPHNTIQYNTFQNLTWYWRQYRLFLTSTADNNILQGCMHVFQTHRDRTIHWWAENINQTIRSFRSGPSDWARPCSHWIRSGKQEMQALSAAASWSAFAPRKLTSTLKCRDRVFNVAGKSMQHVEILFLSSPAEVHRSDCRFRSKPQYSAQNIHKISAE